MEHTQPLGFKDLFTHIIGDMARAICERPNETKQHQFIRIQVATQMILGLMPRDVIEAMLAGHTVMFHALLADSIHDTLQGQIDTMRHRTRCNIVAMNKAFHMNLGQLKHYQARPSEGTREMEEPARKPETRAPGPQKASTPKIPTPPAGPVPAPAQPEIALFRPSPEQIAACRANPEAMAALDAGDAARFARALGIDQPSEAYLAAAAGLPARIDEQALAHHLKQSQMARPGGAATGERR